MSADYLSNKKILVVGGAGFIGSHVNQLLHELGYHTVVFDNLSRGHRTAVVGGEFIQGDLKDRPALEKLFQFHRFDAVMHFAALTDVGESVRNPIKYYKHNVVYTLNLLEAMLATKSLCPFIFSSSAAVYGIPRFLPLTEEHPQQPINPYGASKKTVEELLQACHISHGLPFIALRYFNAAGGDPQKKIKNSRLHENNLIPLVLKKIYHNQPESLIYGDDYPTRDGTCIRDYIHVRDLATAHVSAMEHLWKESSSGIYNLGNGKGFTVSEVLKMIEQITGKKLKVHISPRRPGDPAILVANSAKAQKELGWSPQWGALETIITDAWNALAD